MLNQENVLSFNDDEIMIEFFKIVDIISAFKKIHESWLFVNKEDWYSKELSESIDTALKYVDQLASCVSIEHENVEIEIDIDVSTLKGKQFATVIKSTDEWKILKKYMKITRSCPHQSVTIQSLFDVIHQSILKFIHKM